MTDLAIDMRAAAFALSPRTGVAAPVTDDTQVLGLADDPAMTAVARLYFAIEAVRQNDQPLIVQFAGAAGGEGVSTVASGFARLAANDTRSSVLYVDCKPRQGRAAPDGGTQGLLDVARSGQPLDTAESSIRGDGPAAATPRLRWARLGADDAPGPDPRTLATLADALRQTYSLVVLDCPPLNATPLSGFLSRLADGTILVAAAGKTRRGALQRAAGEVARMGGQVVGIVLNRQQDWLPGWLRRRFA